MAGAWRLQRRFAPAKASQHEDVLELLLSWSRNRSWSPTERGGCERYRLLETLRAYALEQVVGAHDEQSLRHRHATFFLAFQDALCRQRSASKHWLQATAGTRWADFGPRELDQLEVEQDNLRAALRWSVDSGRADYAVNLAEGLYQIADVRGSWSEGHAWLEALLLAPAVATTPAFYERILPLVGTLANRRGDFVTAAASYQEQLDVYTTRGDLLGMATALCALATVHYDRGDCATARAYLERCKAIAIGLEDKELARNWRTRAGQIALVEGRLDDARKLIEQAVAFIGPEYPVWGYSQKDLAWVALEQGAYPEARSLLERSLQTGEERGETLLVALALEGFAMLSRRWDIMNARCVWKALPRPCTTRWAGRLRRSGSAS